jgi:hypothetical protein
MLNKTLARCIHKWASADLAELLSLIAAELHSRAEHKAEYERNQSKPVAGRSSK